MNCRRRGRFGSISSLAFSAFPAGGAVVGDVAVGTTASAYGPIFDLSTPSAPTQEYQAQFVSGFYGGATWAAPAYDGSAIVWVTSDTEPTVAVDVSSIPAAVLGPGSPDPRALADASNATAWDDDRGYLYTTGYANTATISVYDVTF